MQNNFNLACAIYQHSLASPDATAVVCHGRTLSYGELAERAARLAALAAAGDLDGLGRAGHAVKGALLNIGLADLAAAAHTIELQCKQGVGDFDYSNAITDLQYTISLLCEE